MREQAACLKLWVSTEGIVRNAAAPTSHSLDPLPFSWVPSGLVTRLDEVPLPNAMPPHTPRPGLRLVARCVLRCWRSGCRGSCTPRVRRTRARQQGLLTRGVTTDAHVTLASVL